MIDRRLLGATALALILVSGAGCIRGSLPAREFYRLALPPAAAEMRENGALGTAAVEGSMAVLSYETLGLYDGSNLIYRLGELEYGVYPSREWALPLRHMLGSMTERLLGDAHLVSGRVVHDPPSRLAHEYVWKGRVLHFEEVVRGRNVFAAVGLEASIADAETDSILWSGMVELERPVREPTMENIVSALGALAADGIRRLATDAALELRRTAPVSDTTVRR